MVHKSQTPSPELIARAYSWRLEVVAPEHEHRRHLSLDERTLLRDSTSSIDPWRFRLQTRRRDARLHELCARQQKQAYELIRSCLQYYTPIKIVVKSFFLDRNSRYQLTIPPHTTGIDTISDARPARVFGVVYEMKTEPEVGVRTAVSQYENMLLWRSGKHREHARYFNRRANLELKEPFLGTC